MYWLCICTSNSYVYIPHYLLKLFIVTISSLFATIALFQHYDMRVVRVTRISVWIHFYTFFRTTSWLIFYLIWIFRVFLYWILRSLPRTIILEITSIMPSKIFVWRQITSQKPSKRRWFSSVLPYIMTLFSVYLKKVLSCTIIDMNGSRKEIWRLGNYKCNMMFRTCYAINLYFESLV